MQETEYQPQNPDIKEMLQKVRQIRCQHCPRFSVYDKVSKVQIYMDSELGHSYKGKIEVHHICWTSRKEKGKYPQADFKEGTEDPCLKGCKFKPLEEALDIALTYARNGKYRDLEVKQMGYLYVIPGI